MINPNKKHRIKLTIDYITSGSSEMKFIKFTNGMEYLIEKHEKMFNKVKVGDVANCWIQFSIFNDCYRVKSINSIDKE